MSYKTTLKIFTRQEPMEISFWVERNLSSWTQIPDGRGGWQGELICGDLVVKVCSYCGDERHREWQRTHVYEVGSLYGVRV